MSEDQLGRRIFMIMVVVTFSLSILSVLSQQIMYWTSGGVANATKLIFQFAVRSLLRGLLFWYLAKGRKWAKVIFILLGIIGGVAGIFIALGSVPVLLNEHVINNLVEKSNGSMQAVHYQAVLWIFVVTNILLSIVSLISAGVIFVKPVKKYIEDEY